MAAKRLGPKTGVRPGDAAKVKRAFTRMMDDYVSMKESQKKFEASAEDLLKILWPWSIPFRKVKVWRKAMGRR